MIKPLKTQVKRAGIESRRDGKVIRLVLDMEVGFQTFKLHYSPMDAYWYLDGAFLNVNSIKSFVPVWSKLQNLDAKNFDDISKFLVSHNLPLIYVAILPYWIRLCDAWIKGYDDTVSEILTEFRLIYPAYHYHYD